MELDDREGHETLNGRGVIATFAIENTVEVKMMRIRQLRINSNETHQLLLNAMEIFGNIKEN